jgi:O-antigen/teichoic acid export membrane protein
LQHKVYLGPLVEGVLNVIFSIAAAMAFGAIGVAWGTVAGGIVAVAIHYFYNLPRTTPREFSIRAYFLSNIAVPLVVTSPMLVVLVLALHHDAPLSKSIPGMALATLPCALIAWRRYQQIVDGSRTPQASSREFSLVEVR